MRNEEKQKAIAMRREGKTYSEILKVVPVAKSTLSIWFKEVNLAKSQVQRITEKRIAGQRKGAEARRNQRINYSTEIFEKAEKEIGILSTREFWLMGVMLYWAEGSKEKDFSPGSGIRFSNSDPNMIRMFVFWILRTFSLTLRSIKFEIYIHKTYERRIEGVKRYWSDKTTFPLEMFNTVYYKRHNPKTIRKNIGNMYNGLLSVRVKSSSRMLRQITGWTRGVCQNNIAGSSNGRTSGFGPEYLGSTPSPAANLR